MYYIDKVTVHAPALSLPPRPVGVVHETFWPDPWEWLAVVQQVRVIGEWVW